VLRFTALAKLTGHPAVAVPAGYTSAGLPVSLQAIGTSWSEELLLRFALICQSRVARQAPQRFYDLLQ
jgi:Asp-tRNA(Asn)/Glu-tRNA(Gln) amidotransferase A subunit family amidase